MSFDLFGRPTVDPRELTVPPRVQTALSLIALVRQTSIMPPAYEGAPASLIPLRQAEAGAYDAATHAHALLQRRDGLRVGAAPPDRAER